MPRLIDHLARLTGQRDRDLLDATLAQAVNDLVRPRSVAVLRPVGEAGAQHWVTKAWIGLDEPAPLAEPRGHAGVQWPPLSDYPERCAALAGTLVMVHGGAPSTSVFALVNGGDTAVGVVEIVTAEPLAEAALDIVTGILRIFCNFQSLLDYSERDTLTGLLNRKTFDESFFKVIESAAASAGAEHGRRHAGPVAFWLAMVDIDFFKSVNDTYGHLIGDEVLLLLAQLMRGTLRFQDRLYRFGGEEFVIVMPSGSDDDTAALLDRLRQRTEAYAFPQVGRLTISIGFTKILPNDSPSSALERADRSVYQAKAHGRNRVCSHDDLLAQGVATGIDKVGAIELF